MFVIVSWIEIHKQSLIGIFGVTGNTAYESQNALYKIICVELSGTSILTPILLFNCVNVIPLAGNPVAKFIA